MKSFKFAYAAGHFIGSTKGIPPFMGMGDIREWTLNDQVADFIPEAAARYENVELLRVDDPTGETYIDLDERCAAANAWPADYYVEIHHNGGINGGKGGGVVIFSYPGDEVSRTYRDAVYDAIIAAGGLRGDRVSPKQEKRYDTLRFSTVPAGLLECGFMDSTTDAPVIVTREYSKLIAYAIMDGVAKVAGLQLRSAPAEPTEPETPAQKEEKKSNEALATEVIAGKWDNGERRAQLLTDAGYDYDAVQAIVNARLLKKPKDNETLAWEVIAGKWDNGDARRKKLTEAGYDFSAIQELVNRLLAGGQG